MKTKIKRILSVLLVVNLMFICCSCGEKENVTYSLDKTELEINVGDSYTFKITDSTNDISADTFEWESSDESTVMVVLGKIVALKEGNAIVTAKNDENLLSCKVIVKDTQTVNSSNTSTTTSKTTSTASKKSTTSSKSSSVSSNKTSESKNFAHTHNYDSQVITKEPTCTEQGIKTFYCSSCSGTKVEKIPILGHSWQNATCTTPKKCSRCEITEGETLQHEYENYKCKICGKDKVTFNYSWDIYPLNFYKSSDLDIIINSVECYIIDDHIEAIINYTSVSATLFQCTIQLLTSDKKVVADNVYSSSSIKEGKSGVFNMSVSTIQELQQMEGEYYVILKKGFHFSEK